MSLTGIHINNILNIQDKNNKHIKFFQIFVEPLTDYSSKGKYSQAIKYINNNNIKLVVHSSYSINLSRRWRSYDWWIEYVINEIKICHELQAIALVFHTGKRLELSTPEAINNMYTSLVYIHKQRGNVSRLSVMDTSSQF